ncbi:MAG: helix-turn-helix domain-containing protein [Rhodocyclaceae bacterium]|nr:helix-turn-helix domain-containing protein [Rhodocyclaceae bacterium]
MRVTRLRRKIEVDPAAPAYIRTVRGEGYLFTPRGDQG